MKEINQELKPNVRMSNMNPHKKFSSKNLLQLVIEDVDDPKNKKK